jgi:uncharacterized RDD family membrane protein YckC
MKCPKCGYLGFEHVERCRNCGYDFSLASSPLPELPIRDEDEPDQSALDDLALIDAAAPDVRAAVAEGTSSRLAGSANELPLFGRSRFDDDAPLISKPSAPRAPLSVRRATPEVPRVRAHARAPMLDLEHEPEGDAPISPAARAHSAAWPAERAPRVELQPAGLSARGVAVAIDVTILAAIDVVVIYFTLQICGLLATDFAVLPKIPLVAFLILQNGGYLVAFTAGGQTLGKMAMGIRIVPARSEAPIDVARSVIRTVVWVALAAPGGLGFLTALIGHEHRGLHDRCAGTRVVRVTG